MKHQSYLGGIRIFIFAATLGLTMAGCSKEREASLPEDQKENIYSKEIFESSEVIVENQSSGQTLSAVDSLRSNSELGSTKLKVISSPAKLEPMFKNLEVDAEAGSNNTVVFSLDKHHVTALQEITDPQSLSIEQRQILILSLIHI